MCTVSYVIQKTKSRLDPKWDWHIRLGEVSSNFHLSFLSLLNLDGDDDDDGGDDDGDDDAHCIVWMNSELPLDLLSTPHSWGASSSGEEDHDDDDDYDDDVIC